MPAPPETRVAELHRRGVDAINKGRPATGARALRSGLRLLGWPPAQRRSSAAPLWPEQRALTTRLLGALAAAEVAQGNTDHGFALLDSAESLLPEGDQGVLAHHRGLLLLMVGRMDEALAVHDRAISLLRKGSDRLALARTLLNRALLHQTAGRARLAIADLTWCEQLSRELDLPLLVAKAIHGRGACEVLAGDIPAALRAFDTASRGYAAADGMQAVLAVEKARAMLAAGLHSDAATELDDALTRFPGLRMDQEHAEAELTRAHTALAAGDPREARRWAQRAERRFRRRGNLTWASVAALTRWRAEFADHPRTPTVAAHALELADELRALGLHRDADQASLLAARSYVARGDLAKARRYLARRVQPAWETRLALMLARAEYAAAAGDRRATFANARAGLAVLAAHRRGFGSLDLRTGTTSLGVDLVRVGLAAALDHGSPHVIFRWVERARAQAFRFPPAQPIADGETNDAVAELRQLAHTVRSAELAGERDVAAARRCAALERRIRAKGWQADGTSERDEVGFADVRASLADAGSVMVSFLAHAGRLHALVIGEHARLVPLGSLATVAEASARVHGDLDVLCGRVLPAPLEQAVRRSVTEQLAVLAEHLLGPLRPLLGDSDVVFVPTGVLATVPWSLLPDLRGRPVTVTPSAAAWHVARRVPAAVVDEAPLLVAGPDLDNSHAEVDGLAGIYPDATVLSGPHATVEAVLRAVPGRRTVHVAAHGHHEPDNVLFSRLDLVDGPLMAYDVHQLREVPEHVVLSSCDVGQAVVRSGDETLGFTAALLYSGSRSVVSSVARVDDRDTVGVMSAYHKAIRAGRPPARALADALLVAPLMPLVCFGAG